MGWPHQRQGVTQSSARAGTRRLATAAAGRFAPVALGALRVCARPMCSAGGRESGLRGVTSTARVTT
eukprot:14677392-Alexandrium_andersonii.AAC.1